MNSNTILSDLGLRIKQARLRRFRAAESLACSAGISRTTLWKIENGDPAVAIGHYAAVLRALGMENDLVSVAQDEKLAKVMMFQGLENKRGYE